MEHNMQNTDTAKDAAATYGLDDFYEEDHSVFAALVHEKLKRGSLDTVIEKGLEQTWQYMDSVGSVDEGHLIIFDRTKEKSWEERIWHKPYQYNGHTIMVWGM